MSLKILQTADLHIGKTYSSFNEDEDLRSELIQERYDVLDRLVSEANEEACDLFVISGDLFDNPTFRKKKDVNEIRPHLEKFEGRSILILPGNHDYYSERSKDRWEWLEDIEKVTVLKDEKPYDLSFHLEEGKETKIYPAPCDQKRSGEHKLGWIKDIEKDDDIKYHIGVAHGHLEGCSYDEEGKYFPMTKDDLDEADLDLWLLGHVHVMIPGEDELISNYFYPGTPEQEGFKRLAEGSEKGKAWMIEIDEDKDISAEKIGVGKYKFKHDKRRIEDLEDLEKLKTYLEDESNSDTLLKLKIEGKMDKDDFEEAQEYINSLRDDPKGFKYIKLDDDDFIRRIDLDVVKGEFSEGSFQYRLLEEVIDEDDEASEKAAELAYEKFEEVKG